MHHHVHGAVLQRLIGADGATELLACFQVFDGLLEEGVHHTHRLRTQRSTGDIKREINRGLRVALRADERIRAYVHVAELNVCAALRILHRIRMTGHASGLGIHHKQRCTCVPRDRG